MNRGNIALILAGGEGKRAQQSIPKQFVDIDGKPLIIYTVEKFEENPNVDGIVIACHPDWTGYLYEVIKEYGITKVKSIVDGGSTGLESAYNGIVEISNLYSDDSLVLIHDAVRPFVDQETINDNIRVAKEHGLAMCSVQLVETLAYSEDNEYSSRVVPRDNLKRILTPQTFRLDILKEIYGGVDLKSAMEPSTFALYMDEGQPIYLSKGSEKNIKITYPEDIEYFFSHFQ